MFHCGHLEYLILFLPPLPYRLVFRLGLKKSLENPWTLPQSKVGTVNLRGLLTCYVCEARNTVSLVGASLDPRHGDYPICLG
jgi:hypothetical protein